MRNYIKSELYRLSHTKEFYMTLFFFALVALLPSILLRIFGKSYATTSFLYFAPVSNPMIYLFSGIIICSVFYDSQFKHGSLKNTIASGISRSKIFLSQCFVASLGSTVILLTTLLVFILGGELLLKNAGPLTYHDIIKESLFLYLISLSTLPFILGITTMIKNSFLSGLTAFFILSPLPKLITLLALRFRSEIFIKIVEYLPENIFAQNIIGSDYVFLYWNTPEGAFKYLLSGAVSIFVFVLIGLYVFRKKEL